MRKILCLISVFLISACNSVYMKPGTLDTSKQIFAVRGGFGMKRIIKEEMEKRNYDVIVGRSVRMTDVVDVDEFYNNDPKDKSIKAKYVVRVQEKQELFMPWCIFNGFWWWRFSVSIADQQEGKEILSWRGRGCQNSSINKLNDILDELENKSATDEK